MSEEFTPVVQLATYSDTVSSRLVDNRGMNLQANSTVKVDFSGVVELKVYTGSSTIAGTGSYVSTGGTPTVDDRLTFQMTLGDTFVTYNMNNLITTPAGYPTDPQGCISISGTFNISNVSPDETFQLAVAGDGAMWEPKGEGTANLLPEHRAAGQEELTQHLHVCLSHVPTTHTLKTFIFGGWEDNIRKTGVR